MKRRRGDGAAVGGILLGAAVAWSVTSAAWVGSTSTAWSGAPPTGGDAASHALEARHEGVAFRASSLNSTSLVQGDYGGRLTREGDGLTLRVPVAQIRNSTGSGAEDALLVGVRLLLMDDTAEGWRVVREGELHVLREVLSPGEELWLTDLELELAGVTEEEAEGRWLVVEHELAGWSEAGVPRSLTYAYAPLEILWLLYGWEVDGC